MVRWWWRPVEGNFRALVSPEPMKAVVSAFISTLRNMFLVAAAAPVLA